MRRIKVVREGGFYGKLRSLKLVLDGVQVGHINEGEEIEIELPEGATTLRGQMDWAKTAPLSVADLPEGSVVVFKARFTLNPLRQLGIMSLPFKVSLR